MHPTGAACLRGYLGFALATNPVYVNGELAYRKAEYFRKELSVNNASGPVWQQVTVTASGEPTITGNLFVPRTPEPFTYDLDGNMTSDGRWNYTWDAENRLVKAESRPDTPQASWRQVEWQYDALGRRIRQITYDGSSGSWVVTEDLKFVCDPLLYGRHIMELRASDNAPVRSYAWGLDLSGSLGGAGGVGGLVWVALHTASGAAAGTHFAGYDGNGNVVALVSAASGTETARYEYGPFGEPIRLTGPAATQNPFRFSTKRTDSTTDLVLYEYRAYNPTIGRWLSRDPIEEEGGENVHSFTINGPVNQLDVLGMSVLEFSSVAKVYFDPIWRLFCYDRVWDASGKRNTPDASFFQAASEVGHCPGGICNSGGTDESSSFLRIYVKNVSRCPIITDCECTLTWIVSNYTPIKKGRKGVVVHGKVLGYSFSYTYLPKPEPDGSYRAFGFGVVVKQNTIYLKPGVSEQLVYGSDVNASPPLTIGAGFSELMVGKCSCGVR